MGEAWVRLSSKCQNRCLFCSVGELDGTVVPKDEVIAAVDAAVDGGASTVVLTGGEPTLSPALLHAIKHAHARGARVALNTNGRIVQSEKVARMLEGAGLDEVRVSVHSGRRTTHDALAQSKDAWVEGLAGRRFAGRTSMRVVLRSIVSKHNLAELAHLMHLGTMAGVSGHEIMRLRPVGRMSDPEELAKLDTDLRHGLRLIGSLWFDAKEEQLLFTAKGWEHSQDAGVTPEGEPRQADRAALRLLRDRVVLHPVAFGTTAIDEQGMGKDFVVLVQEEGDLAEVGWELHARSAPLLDMPFCVGGRPAPRVDHGAEAIRGEGCGDCAARGCPGVPRKLRKICGDALRPPPHWQGLAGAGVVLGGQGALLREHVLPELTAALTERGLPSTLDGDLAGASWAVCADAASAKAALEQVETVVLLDTAQHVPDPRLRVMSWLPGRVDALRGAVPLRQVHMRAFPAPSPRQTQGGPTVVALGETANWSSFERAVLSCTGTLPVIDVFANASGLTDTGQIRVHEADEAAILEAIWGARMVVLPLARPTVDDAAHRAALARDTRWISVAAAAGVPVVAVRAPGVEDQVRHDLTGWLVEAGSASALSTALRRVLNEAVRFSRYQKGARAMAAQCSVQRWADQLVEGHRPWEDALVKTEPRPWPVW